MTTVTSKPSPLVKLKIFAADIKLAHSVFALPFALLAMVLASRVSGGLHAGQVGLIIACMVFARTAAMAANRLLDAKLDLLNPRTRVRAIPSGQLSRAFVLTMLVACVLLFNATALGFGVFYDNWWPGMFALPVAAFIAAYPLTKRFTWLCHLYLGVCLGLAPVCAWVAVAGEPSAAVLLLGGAVALWTAGFDVIYATQDQSSDLETGVRSLPARFGIAGSLWIARGLHLGSVLLLLGTGWASPDLHVTWQVAVAVAAIALASEHVLVRPGNLARAGFVFFVINAWVSLWLGLAGVVDALWL